MAARKMYPERCISVSDSSGSTSIDAMHGKKREAYVITLPHKGRPGYHCP
jgi:hypothetical protein